MVIALNAVNLLEDLYMRLGCLVMGIVLYLFGVYGLYVSWEFYAPLIFTFCVLAFFGFVFVRIRKNADNENDEQQIEDNSEFQPVLQNPDVLFAKFRRENEQKLDEEEMLFQRAVEEVKNKQYEDDSARMTWIRTFEQYTDRFMQRAQLKTKEPLLKRLNVLLIANSLLYIRVFVNLVEIASTMHRLPEETVKRLDDALVRLSKYEFERLIRIIALHFVHLFLNDHGTSIYFNESFTKRLFTSAVIDGLSFSKQETLLLQGIQTDTQYMEVLLNQLNMDASQPLIDLAKTSFENTKTRLIEKIINELQ